MYDIYLLSSSKVLEFYAKCYFIVDEFNEINPKPDPSVAAVHIYLRTAWNATVRRAVSISFTGLQALHLVNCLG